MQAAVAIERAARIDAEDAVDAALGRAVQYACEHLTGPCLETTAPVRMPTMELLHSSTRWAQR